MLIKVFKSNQKLINGLVILITLFLGLPSFFIEHNPYLIRFISTGYFWLDISIVILLISLQAIYLNAIANEYKLLENNTHLTSLLFVLFNTSFVLLFNLNQVVIANTFVLLGVHQLFRLYANKGSFSLSFNAGFLISIATLIYLPNGIFLLLLWFGLIYLISPKWRDFVITIFGFCLPIVYVISYNLLTGGSSSLDLISYNLTVFKTDDQLFPPLAMVLFFLILGVILLAYFKLSSGIGRGGLRRYKMLVVLILMSLFGVGTLFFNKFDYLATFVVLTIPASVVVASFFQNLKKKWLAELLFMILVVLIVLNYFS